MDPAAGNTPTLFDVTENKLQLHFVELETAQMVRSLPDVHAAVFNVNYALQPGLNPITNGIFLEGAESPYVNVIAVRAGDEQRPELQQLVVSLLSEEVRAFAMEKCPGAVVPVF